MRVESEVVRLLSAQQRVWRTHFPTLTNRVQQSIVDYLCTRARAGAPVRQVYGVTKELFLLDDSTVRDRITEIQRLGLCETDPPEEKLSGRTIVTPTPALLRAYDASLLALMPHLDAALRAIRPSAAMAMPVSLTARHRQAILAVFDGHTLAWLAAADRLLTERGVSPARRAEARRHLTSSSYWMLMQRAIEHRYGLAGAGQDDSMMADQLAASVIDVTGQSFQTTRDHIAWLIGHGLLDRHPGRTLRVALAERAVPHVARALVQTAEVLEDAAGRLTTGRPPAAFGRTVDETLRTGTPIEPEPPAEADAIAHSLVIVSPADAARRIVLSQEPLVIGRTRPSHVLLAEPAVSRAHCRVEIIDDRLVVTDLRSTNGTFIDGQRLADSAVLEPGVALRIGSYCLEYRRDSVGSGAAWDADGTLHQPPPAGTRSEEA